MVRTRSAVQIRLVAPWKTASRKKLFFVCADLLHNYIGRGDFITIYKANTANIVYVNGEEKGRLTFFSFSHYIEIKLPDGVKATISFGRGLFMPIHVSYSDNTPSVDL